jgi:DGQHR domain-containing protein
MGKETMKVPAIKIEQADTVLYLTYLRGVDLVEGMTQVDAWSPGHKTGYQRIPTQARFRKIAKYIQRKQHSGRPILPQSVVLNHRDADHPLKFTATDRGPLGTLELRQEENLWEVDGQHRLGGVRTAVEENPAMGEYPVPIVITQGLTKLDEAVLFFVVNTNQKRVPTDLAQRLIEQQMKDPDMKMQLVAGGKDWISKGVKVVDAILATSKHPWEGKIGIPGTKTEGALTKQVSFVTSLKPLLTSIYGRVEPEEIAQLLIRYWKAIEAVYPEALADPDEYVIQKTVGIFPLHAVAQEIFDMVRNSNGKVTLDALTEVFTELDSSLSKDGMGGSDFWHREDGEAAKYGSQKGFRMLADILRDHLPKSKKLQFV